MNASESFPVPGRARVPVAVVLAALLAGAAAGCQGSAPEPSTSDRKPAQAAVKETAPAPAPVMDERDAVEAVARGFLTALKERHPDKAEAFLTARARKTFAKSVSPDRGAGQMLGATYQLGVPTITGDTADIPVILREAGQEQKSTLKLRREGGKWAVFAQAGRIIPDDPSTEIVMNFEEPEAIAGQLLGGKPEDIGKAMEKNFKEGIERAEKDFIAGKPEAADLAVEALESIRRDQFDAAWKVNIPSKGRPAGDVLRDLARAVDRRVETTAIQDRALARPVTIDVRGHSRLQAIEEVARSAGLSPVYAETVTSFDPSAGGNPVQAALRLRPRRGPNLVASAGPFLVEVLDLKEAVPYATAVLSLRVAASGLPAVVLNDLQRGQQESFIVTDAVDAQGRSLMDTEAAASGGMSMGRVMTVEFDRTKGLALKGLLREVSTIKRLRGRVRVTLPVRVETIRFDALTPGETRKVGDLELTLKTVRKGAMSYNGKQGESWNFSIAFRRNNPDQAKPGEPGKKGRPAPGGIGPDRVKIVGHDAQGRPVRTGPSGYFQSDLSSWRSDLTLHGPATSLVVKVITEVDAVDYEFVLEDIPLPSHGKMPERIEPAVFAGHESPAAVDFVSIGGNAPFQTAQLRVTNHSNKDIRMLGMKLDYLGPDGRRLGGWDRQDQWGTPWKAGGSPVEPSPILVARGAKSVFEIRAPFLKQGTRTISVTVRTVRFADAETWTAPVVTKK